jgi:hypothetical protein
MTGSRVTVGLDVRRISISAPAEKKTEGLKPTVRFPEGKAEKLQEIIQ